MDDSDTAHLTADAIHIASLEKRLEKQQKMNGIHLRANAHLADRVVRLQQALAGVGKCGCWCEGDSCSGQPQCRAAREALAFGGE